MGGEGRGEEKRGGERKGGEETPLFFHKSDTACIVSNHGRKLIQKCKLNAVKSTMQYEMQYELDVTTSCATKNTNDNPYSRTTCRK